jgi:putative ABC transport system substrate-binding protein
MRRRDFFGLVGGVAAWPLAARAQQPGPLKLLGVLMGPPEAEAEPVNRALRQGLQEFGWTEGRNLRIEFGTLS